MDGEAISQIYTLDFIVFRSTDSYRPGFFLSIPRLSTGKENKETTFGIEGTEPET